jgi:hypothetical protein
MRLDTSDWRDLVLISPALAQCYVCKQGQHPCRRWVCCEAFVAWELRFMRASGETDLSLHHAGDQQAQDRQHG